MSRTPACLRSRVQLFTSAERKQSGPDRRDDYQDSEVADHEWGHTTRAGLNAVEAAVEARFGLAGFPRETVDLQAVAFHAETMLGGDALEDFIEFGRMELDELSRFSADEMVVLGIAVMEFVEIPSIGSRDLSQPASLLERGDGTVDSGTADAAAVVALRQAGDKLVNVKVFVLREDFINDEAALGRQALAPGDQEFSKLLGWRNGHVNRF